MRALPLLALLALSGCASLLTGGPLIRHANDPLGQIVVVNQSSRVVTSVLISHCRESSYGLNRMARGESIPPGGDRAFTVSAGCWDVLAGNAGAEARMRMEVPASGGVRYTVHD